MYPDAPKPPCVVGYEASGTIDLVGDGVVGFAVGQRVLAMTNFGAHASMICVPAENLVAMPESMSMEHAAALGVNYLTAYHMLFRVAGLRAGQSVLVHMAAGGVGTAALQLCRSLEGVTVIGTASRSKHEFIKANGCTHAIDYHTQDYASEVMRLTEGRGVHIVLDSLGGAHWKRACHLLRPGGKVIAFGFSSLMKGSRRSLWHVVKSLFQVPRFNPMKLMNENKGVCGVHMGHLWGEREMIREEVGELLALYTAGKIAPHVDSVFSLEDAARAHQRLEQRANQGKVLLRP